MAHLRQQITLVKAEITDKKSLPSAEEVAPTLRSLKRSLFVLAADIYKAINSREEPVELIDLYL